MSRPGSVFRRLLVVVVGLALGAARATVRPASRPSPAVTPSPPDVVLITIDTLRADHLHCYGYPHIETPNIDALAQASVRFSQAYTPVPITLPAHTALMTGSYPMATGMHDFSGNKLSPDAVTLARVLKAQGYQTAAFVSAAVLDSRFGLNLGFDTYYDHFNINRLDEASLDLTERKGDQTTNLALAWLHDHAGRAGEATQQPFFLWVHLYDPHYPYTPPEPYATRYRAHLYDGEIAFADAQVGRLAADLKARGLWERSLVLLAGDHGEGLGEHGEKTHGFFIYNSTLHVPLLIHLPEAAPRVVDPGVSLVDVMPTVLQALKIPIPPSVQGRSLLSLAFGRTTSSGSVLYAETYLPLLHFGWSPLRGLETRGLQYIEAPRPELYNTRGDPQELRNVYSTRQALGRELHDELYGDLRRLTPAGGNTTAARELTDPALLDRLRSLGYVAISAGTFAESSGKPLPDPKDRIEVYELFSQAMSDGQHGRYQESLDKLSQAVKSEPASLPIRYLEALDYYRLKDYPRAVERFQAALELDPKFALASYYLGLAQTETKDFDGAIGSFQRALELDPTNFDAAFNLGAAELRKDRVEDAIKAFDQATQINPNYARAYEALGEMYLYQKRPEDAARALERAIELVPVFTKAHYNLGRAYQALGRSGDAQKEFDRAKQLQSQMQSGSQAP
jgi:arylsulfatase A-like enzyme/Flp pilus assembly protein TadD